MTPDEQHALEEAAVAIVAELIRHPGSVTDPTQLDPVAAKAEARRLIAVHADALAELGVSTVFDVLAGPQDLNYYRALVSGLSDDALVHEIQSTTAALRAVAAHREARIAMLREFAAVSAIVLRGVLGAMLESQLSRVAGRV